MGKKRPDKRAFNTLTEQAESFDIEGLDGKQVTLHLYPLQLGRLMMLSQRFLELDFAFTNEGDNDVKRMWEICATKANEVAEIIAISTLRTKSDIEEHLGERKELILHSPSMTPNATANLLMAILFQSYFADFMQAIRSVRTLQVQITQPTEAERIAPMAGGVFGVK